MADVDAEPLKRVRLVIARLRLDKHQDALAAEALDRLRHDWNEAGLAQQPLAPVVDDPRAEMSVDWPTEGTDPCGKARQLLIQALAHVQVAHRIYWRAEDEPGRADELDRYLAITLNQLECEEARSPRRAH